jgi:uncharacterized protein
MGSDPISYKLPAMGRILFWLVLAALAYLVFRGMLRAPGRAEAKVRAAGGESMVACARCGVNVPRSEAREEGGRWVCQGNPACR